MDENNAVRLTILSGTDYESNFKNFAKRMNGIVRDKGFHIEIIRSTFPKISQIIFNNHDKGQTDKLCKNINCFVCRNDMVNRSRKISSNLTNVVYHTESNLNCDNGGIYVISGKCDGQYTGKSVNFYDRNSEHFGQSKLSAIYTHKVTCNTCIDFNDFEVTYVENVFHRGKFTLSEREFLWNSRIRGTINIQKTLKM